MRYTYQTLIKAIILSLISSNAFAITWHDLWQRPDQQGAAALQAGQPAAAAQLYTDPNWQAVAHYRAKQYQQAYQAFSQDKSATGYFNQGNALANMGQIDKAINAYKQALALNPSMADATYNKALLEKMQQQSKQNQQNNNQQNNNDQQQNQNNQQNNSDQQQNQNNQQNNSDQQQNQNNQQNNSDQQQNQNNQQNNGSQQQNQNNQQNNSDQQQNQNNQQSNGDQQQNQNDSQNRQANNDKQSMNRPIGAQASTTAQQTAQQQATQQWLDSIPDDPGGLLKQKFLRDHATYQQSQQQGQQPW
jgi:Ca-activated chloride channel family protein